MSADSRLLGLPFFGEGRRRRTRISRACALIQEGVTPEEAASAAGLKPDEISRLATHSAFLVRQQERLAELREFALGCGDDSSDRLLHAVLECAATLHEMRRALSAGELDLGVLRARLERFVERADDIRGDIEDSIALTERASGLLDELDGAVKAIREQVETSGLPRIEPAFERIGELEASAERLRKRAKRNGYSKKVITATLAAAEKVCATDIGEVLEAARSSLGRVRTIYTPAIEALVSATAPYAGESGSRATRRPPRSPKPVSLEHYDPFTEFESADYLRLSSLTLQAMDLLSDGQPEPAAGDWDVTLRLNQCTTLLAELDEWPDLTLERAYVTGVHAVAQGWLHSERAQRSAKARGALRTFLPIDPPVQSDYLHQLRQVLADEMVPRARARLRALESQMSGPGNGGLETAWRQMNEDLGAFADRDVESLTVADGDLMRGFMTRVDELERAATIAVANARRLAGLSETFEEVLIPKLERLRLTQTAPQTRGLFDIAELGLGGRVATLTGRVTALGQKVSGAQPPRTQEDVHSLLERADSLLASIVELEDEVASMSAVEADWQRCVGGEITMIESGMVAGISPEQALKAMERLYILRRQDQPAVLLGDSVLFPSPLNERNWDALSGELLAPDRSPETNPDERPLNYDTRIGLLLDAWEYVVPPMLWYECGSVDAARERMKDYVVHGQGKGRTVMQGKTIRLNIREQRRKTGGESKSRVRKDATKEPDSRSANQRRVEQQRAAAAPGGQFVVDSKGRRVEQQRAAAAPGGQFVVDSKGRKLREGDEVDHVLVGRCTLVRIVGEDRVWLRFPDGSTKSVILSQTPLR